MPTDDERRKVARNIRENYSRSGLGCKVASTYNIALAVGIVPEIIVGDVELWNRLADLIEPSCDRDTPQKVAEEMFGKMRHSMKEEADAYDDMLKSKSVEIYPINREELLALVDEMDEVAQRRRSMGYEGFAIGDEDRASRIREALMELADEMDAYTKCDDERCGREMPPRVIHDFARRIREALE